MTVKKETVSKTKKQSVTLREKPLSNGNVSLYLDIYRDGKRKKEYLGMHITPNSKNPSDKIQDKETLMRAEAIRSKRQTELYNNEYGFSNEFKSDTLFLDYYRKMCSDRLGSVGNWAVWSSCLKHLEIYCTEKTTFKDITPEWIEGFRTYLETAKDARSIKAGNIESAKPISLNTKSSYFKKLRACINHAFEKGIIQKNPLRGIKNFDEDETNRQYLTFDEVKKMVHTECKYPMLKRAFLFSCLTGIRKSDIEKMTWSEVQTHGNTTRIIFKQQKTGAQKYLNISTQAVEYLGERGKKDEQVFKGFIYNNLIFLE